MITSIQPFKLYQQNFTSKFENNFMVSVNREPVTPDTLNKLANSWAEQDLLYEGDSIFIIPKQQLYDAAKYDKKIAETLPKVNLSDLGFAATIMEEDGRIDTRALQYFDPKVITILKLVNQIRNNKTYIIPLEAKYLV